MRPLGSAEAMLASLWQQTLERFGHDDAEVAHTAATTYWQKRLRSCQPYPDVLPFLADLTRRFHVSLLTNGAPSMQRAKVHASGSRHIFGISLSVVNLTRANPPLLFFLPPSALPTAAPKKPCISVTRCCMTL